MLTRRTLTRSAVWTLPVVATAAAAPTWAASGGSSGLTMTWVAASWQPFAPLNVSHWRFVLQFDNAGSDDATVTKLEVYSTYGTPAVPTTAAVQTLDDISLLVRRGDTLAFSDLFFPSGPQGVPPTADNHPITLTYYSGSDDGSAPCVASPLHPSDTGYPHSGQRLRDDDTSIVATYVQRGTVSQVATPMGSSVGCTVAGDLCTT